MIFGLFRTLLIDRRWRWLVGYTRFWWLKTFRGLRTCHSSHARPKTLSHNLTAFEHIGNDFLMPRMARLIHAMMATEELNLSSAILVVGPRTENDLLLLHGYGYRNVRGIDLISYSPWIVTADMHAIPFPDDSFDAVLCGWAISYSAAPERAGREFIRVLRDGGILALGIEHVPVNDGDASDSPSDPRLMDREPLGPQVNTAAQLLDLFKGSIRTTYTCIDAPLVGWKLSELQQHTGLSGSQIIITAAITKSTQCSNET